MKIEIIEEYRRCKAFVETPSYIISGWMDVCCWHQEHTKKAQTGGTCLAVGFLLAEQKWWEHISQLVNKKHRVVEHPELDRTHMAY